MGWLMYIVWSTGVENSHIKEGLLLLSPKWICPMSSCAISSRVVEARVNNSPDKDCRWGSVRCYIWTHFWHQVCSKPKVSNLIVSSWRETTNVTRQSMFHWESFATHTHWEGRWGGCQLYLRQMASRKSLLWRRVLLSFKGSGLNW
jgi:hypothetical protein